VLSNQSGVTLNQSGSSSRFTHRLASLDFFVFELLQVGEELCNLRMRLFGYDY